ncbi:MAG TPA: S8 family serine peptidase, partial [Methylibium sp.]
LGVDCYVMAVPPDRAPEHVAQVLSQDARVAWAQPMNIYRAQQQAAAAAPTHNDPLYPAQPAAAAWHLAALHELATGREVRVAVIDSGIEQNHPDLDGQVALARNFVPARPDAPEQHGTAVAGIIAARADNGIGIAGVAPRARLLALRACWQESRSSTLCSSLSLAMALDFAISHDAQVINLSLGGAPDRLLGKLLDAALVRGITVVAAADRSLPGGGFPAGHPGVVAVSDEAPNPPAGALLAPGRDVPTTTLGAHWNLVSGSSYAAAHVSGLFALVRELHRSPLPAASTTLSVLPSGGIDTCATLLRFVSPRACACANMRATPPPIAQQ